MADGARNVSPVWHPNGTQAQTSNLQGLPITMKPSTAKDSTTYLKRKPVHGGRSNIKTADNPNSVQPLLGQQDQEPYLVTPHNTEQQTMNTTNSWSTQDFSLKQISTLPKGWPKSPQPIKVSRVCVVLNIVFDICLLTLSIGFFALGFVVYSYDQKPILEHEKALQVLIELSSLGPTIFPLLFACVVGRAVQIILVWQLQRGTTIGIGDMLAGSTSFIGTLTSQLQLRIMSMIGMALIFVWALSPFGGQASLRQISIGPRISNESVTFTYMTPSENLVEYNAGSARESYFAIANALFVGSLIAPVAIKQSTLDSWSNVKVPMIEPYEDAAVADAQGWFSTSDSSPVYSSLVGIPVTRFEQTGALDYSWSIETSYLSLQCSKVGQHWDLGSPLPSNVLPVSDPESFIYGAAIWSNDNNTERVESNPEDLQPRSFTYLSFGPANGASNCTVSTTYIEAQISCNGTSSCAVVSLRRSRQAHPQPGYTFLDSKLQGNITNWDIFASEFVTAIPGHPFMGTAVQNYFVEPDNPLLVPDTIIEPLYWKYHNMTVSTEDFAVRLGQLMNAYWICLTGIHVVSGGVSPATVWMAGTNLTSAPDEFLAYSNTTQGTRTKTTQVIICHIGWTVVLCIASTVLIVAIMVSVVARYLSHGPILMLNISSLATRDNRYVTLPATGTSLSASRRARLLKDFKIKLGDVNHFDDTGLLAIASLETPWSSQAVGNIRKDRKYI